jgi:hypothetical protein
MSNNDAPYEYMHFFNAADNILGMEPTEVGNQQVDLCNVVNIEQYHWKMSDTRILFVAMCNI